MPLRALPPQGSASANFATWAVGLQQRGSARRLTGEATVRLLGRSVESGSAIGGRDPGGDPRSERGGVVKLCPDRAEWLARLAAGAGWR